jgi:small subunit ribosomal protein S17
VEERKHKIRIGRVVSDKMDKTITVAVEFRRRHPQYKKVIKHTVKFKAHDEGNACKVGDVVKITETRPFSKQKRWRLVEIITREEGAKIQQGEIESEPEENDSKTNQA